jgi:ParB/RepB/Spo0J family partition protein
VNAPEGGILLQQPTIALSQIVVSKTNPRKSFDKLKHEELTQSVKLKGVINPILVRPLDDGGYEVVAGERRFKAAKAAGLAEIPATVKPLSDAEALELQVIENNQREDLHPLEEAEGFEALLKCKHADGSKYSVDDVAEKIGKSKSYVYKKMKLCDCCQDVRQAFYDGKIDFSKALLLAQVHGEKLQRQALAEITRPWIGGEPMTFRAAHQHVQHTYMLALEKAPFPTKDEKLVAKAGPCTTCPKRTGNAPELFADVKAGDMCTDPQCFSSKREAHHNAERQTAIAAGRTVIGGKEAKKIKPYQHSDLQGGYVSVEQRCWEDSKNRTYGQIIGTKAEPALLDDPHAKGVFREGLQDRRHQGIPAEEPQQESRSRAELCTAIAHGAASQTIEGSALPRTTVHRDRAETPERLGQGRAATRFRRAAQCRRPRGGDRRRRVHPARRMESASTTRPMPRSRSTPTRPTPPSSAASSTR